LNALELPSSAAWLGDMIERAARLAHDTETARPVSVTAPMAALADRDAPMAAEAGVKRSNLLPQEVRIDFSDASVIALEDLALDRIDAFRRRGFRVGLDARKSWRTPMGQRARMSFEAVRLDPSRMEILDVPMSRLEVAAADGVALIAENVRWRDAEKLAEHGIHFAMSPRADG
jgi:predicted signal transduction protein with EAL and GGDEF domain